MDLKNAPTVNGSLLVPTGGSAGQVLQKNSGTDFDTLWGSASGGSSSGASLYPFLGDGSDGAITLDGTYTNAAFTKSGNVYTMIRDLVVSSLTINSGITLAQGGYRLMCTGTVTVNGTVVAGTGSNVNGTAGGSGGNSFTAQQTGAAGGGGGGGTAVGSAGGAVTTAIGGAGGAAGSGINGAGGGGGTITAPPSSQGAWRLPFNMAIGANMTRTGTSSVILNGGAGGGGGGGDGTNKGGGGGSGGAVLLINAKTIAGSGAIQARGGNGGTPTVGNCGGGAGGGGGAAILNTTAAISGPTIDANGGAAGLASGSGANGSAGSNGTVIQNVWA